MNGWLPEQRDRVGRRSARRASSSFWEAVRPRPRRPPFVTAPAVARSSRRSSTTPGYYLDNIVDHGVAHVARSRHLARRSRLPSAPLLAAFRPLEQAQPTGARADPGHAVGRLHHLDRNCGSDAEPRRSCSWSPSSPFPPFVYATVGACAAPTSPPANCSRRSTLRGGRCSGGCGCPSATAVAVHGRPLQRSDSGWPPPTSPKALGRWPATGSARSASGRSRSNQGYASCGPRSCARRCSVSSLVAVAVADRAVAAALARVTALVGPLSVAHSAA